MLVKAFMVYGGLLILMMGTYLLGLAFKQIGFLRAATFCMVAVIMIGGVQGYLWWRMF